MISGTNRFKVGIARRVIAAYWMTKDRGIHKAQVLESSLVSDMQISVVNQTDTKLQKGLPAIKRAGMLLVTPR